MTAKWYRILKALIIIMAISIVLLLLFVSLLHSNIYAQEQESDTDSNTITFVTEKTDYDNRLLFANAKIHLTLEANEENVYLILPIEDKPGLRFYIEPNNSKRTIMHGFLAETGYLVVQFSPSALKEEIDISINDIQMSIKESSDEEAFGYYYLGFNKANEKIPAYINNLIEIDMVRVSDNNILSSEPKAIQDRRGLITFSDDKRDVSIFVSKQEKATPSLIIPLIVGTAFLLVDLVCAFYRNEIKAAVIKNQKHKGIISVITVIIIAVEIYVFIKYIIQTQYYTEATIFFTCIGGFINTVILVWWIIKHAYLSNSPMPVDSEG